MDASNRSDKERFAAAYAGVAEVQGRTVTKAAMSIFFSAVKQYDIEDVEAAFTAHLLDPDHGRFLPTPADIERHIGGDSKSRGIAAWNRVLDAISAHGRTASVIFDAKTMRAVQTMGGWEYLCSSDEDQKWLEKRFVEHYSAAREKDAPAKLVGSAARENAALGHHEFIPAPIDCREGSAIRIGAGPIPSIPDLSDEEAAENLKKISSISREVARGGDFSTRPMDSHGEDG